MTPEKPPISRPLAAAIQRLSEWNEGGETSTMPLGYGPDTIAFQVDLRMILTEYREIAAESARIARKYEALDSIIQELRAPKAAS
jgi:hypothetical protein